jgi:hypothetical protein
MLLLLFCVCCDVLCRVSRWFRMLCVMISSYILARPFVRSFLYGTGRLNARPRRGTGSFGAGVITVLKDHTVREVGNQSQAGFELPYIKYTDTTVQPSAARHTYGMVFANLTEEDKEAFFALLDE